MKMFNNQDVYIKQEEAEYIEVEPISIIEIEETNIKKELMSSTDGSVFENEKELEIHKEDQFKYTQAQAKQCLESKCTEGTKTDSKPETSQAKSIIEDLLEKPFATRSFSEKRFIIQTGRPCPKLLSLKSAHKESKREYMRKFKETQFSLYPWLAGCENKKKLFCWPCLLFSKINSVWNSSGVSNLNTLNTLKKKHKKMASHLKCVLKLARFGENRTNKGLNFQLQNTHHNIQVKKNRDLLRRLIDVICFLTNQELSFRGHDESITSLNRGNYIETIHLLKQYDPTLSHYFETETSFNITSITIQNDLIKAIGEVLSSYIYQKIEKSEFVAIMVDMTSDIKSQLSVVLRYYSNKKIHETFVGFIDVSSGRTAEDLFKSVTVVIEKYDIRHKLVAQTYDGASVMSGHLNELQMKVKNISPKVLLIHSYAYVLNFLLSQGLNNIRECRIFFTALNGIENFGSTSSENKYALKEFLIRQIPSLAETKWCFSSRLVNVVDDYADIIQLYFESIENDDDETWEVYDRMAASGYGEFLKSIDTVFLLKVFSKLFVHSDVLFDTLQNSNVDIIFCSKEINKFSEFLKVQKDEGFQEIWESTLQTLQSQYDQEQQFNSNESKYKELFIEIIDNLCIQIQERCSSFEMLKYFNFLNGNIFSKYRQNNEFPEEILTNLIENYPDIFEFSQLKNELMVFYKNTNDIIQLTSAATSEATTPFDVLFWMESKNIAGSFEQMCKLSKLICTVPSSTASLECEPTQKRINTYLRNTQEQQGLDYLALISIEKEFLKELKESDGFYDRVVEKFLANKRRAEFMYR